MSTPTDQWQKLAEVTRILREPGGCSWDRAQDERSMRAYLLEESYEVIEAVNRGDIPGIREELGDIMFLVFFYSRLYEEKGDFSLKDVLGDVADKLIRRHPHVFGTNQTNDVAQILSNWEKIKVEEKGKPAPGLPKEGFLPALMRAYKVQEKAARKGFDWKYLEDVIPALESEVIEFKEAARNESAVRQEDELGDILFTIVNCFRHLQIEPEVALHRAIDKFQERFKKMQTIAGEGFDDLPLEEKEKLWQKSK